MTAVETIDYVRGKRRNLSLKIAYFDSLQVGSRIGKIAERRVRGVKLYCVRGPLQSSCHLFRWQARQLAMVDIESAKDGR
jgi:hypothetical protein